MIGLVTSSYRTYRLEIGVPVRISVERPGGCSRQLAGDLKELMPLGLTRIESPDEFDRLYVARLQHYGTERITHRLGQIAAATGADTLVLVCFEPTDHHCHRRLFAQWWQLRTGQGVPEAPTVRQPPTEAG